MNEQEVESILRQLVIVRRRRDKVKEKELTEMVKVASKEFTDEQWEKITKKAYGDVSS
jgi:hypothetical protein